MSGEPWGLVEPKPATCFVHVAEDPDSVCLLQLQLMHSRVAEEVVPAAGRVDDDGSAATAAERGKAYEPSDVIVRQPQFGDFPEVHQLPEGRLEAWINEQVPDSWPYLVQCDHACGGPEDHPEGLVDPVGEGHVQPLAEFGAAYSRQDTRRTHGETKHPGGADADARRPEAVMAPGISRTPVGGLQAPRSRLEAHVGLALLNTRLKSGKRVGRVAEHATDGTPEHEDRCYEPYGYQRDDENVLYQALAGLVGGESVP